MVIKQVCHRIFTRFTYRPDFYTFHTQALFFVVMHRMQAGNFTWMGLFTTFRTRMRASSIPSLLLNKYLATLFVFGIWMTFFDENNFIRQYHRITELNAVQRKTGYYVKETEKAKKQLYALKTNQHALERFAREEYYMKKPNEDVYIILEE